MQRRETQPNSVAIDQALLIGTTLLAASVALVGLVPVVVRPTEGESSSDAARSAQWREIGLGAQILRDLDISSIRLLSSRQWTYVGLAGFDIEVASTEALEG